MAVFKEGQEISGCVTQDGFMPTFGELPEEGFFPEGTHPIMIGITGMIPRWDIQNTDTKHCILHYYLQSDTFESPEEAALINTRLQQAADLWNSIDCGVTFVSTTDPANAHFTVVYSTERKPGVAASAFFPNRVDQLKIYSAAFNDPSTRRQLLNSITHEFGHILGLRHEAPGRGEDVAELFGEPNEDSIMGYNRATRKLQESDKEGLRKFYLLPSGTNIGSYPVTDFPPHIKGRST